MLFRNRVDAGRKLAAALARYDGQAVVFALPRGGVEVAAEVAAALHAPLDLVLVRKVGAPHQPELAMGAVVDGVAPIAVRNEEVIRLTHTTDAQFDALAKRELAEIERRRRIYMGDRKPVDTTGRVAIVIDDGIATGATVRAALRAMRAHGPEKLVLAVPVAPVDTIEDLRRECDEIVCLATPEPFGAVGYFYDDFGQLDDEDVIRIMARFRGDAASSMTNVTSVW